MQVRVLARRPGAVGPEHAEPEAAEPEAVARARLDDRHAAIRRLGERGALERAGDREPRIEHAIDREPPQDVLGAADVVALRVREHERGEPPDAEAAQLARDVRLRRPLVDEHRALGHLEQDRVALADVEEGDPQPGRRRQARAPEASCQASSAGSTAAALATASGRRHRGSRCRTSSATGVPSSRQTAVAEPTCANGSPPISRAQAAM